MSRIQKPLKMSKREWNMEQIIRYLKNLLSNSDRHQLEKEMMRDAFDNEAFEGLTQLSGEELEADMEKLTGLLNQRAQRRKVILFRSFARMAAAIAVLTVIGAALFFILRKPAPEFISQDLKKIPAAPVQQQPVLKPSETITENDQTKKENAQSSASVKSTEKETIAAGSSVKAMDRTEPIHEHASENMAKSMREPAPEVPAQETIQNPDETLYITGRIVGADHQALAGVSIMETGKNKQATLSDVDGNFRLPVQDHSAPLTVSRFGYESMEVSSKEVSGKDITLVADPLALNDLVVIGYGTAKKEKATPSSRKKVVSDTLTAEIQAPFDLSKPVPPGGSLKSFEKWVEERIQFDLFNEEQGDFNIPVRLTIRADGSIRNVRIGKGIPPVIAQEYTRIIRDSPLWQPAQDGGVPVDAEVEMVFVLIITE